METLARNGLRLLVVVSDFLTVKKGCVIGKYLWITLKGKGRTRIEHWGTPAMTLAQDDSWTSGTTLCFRLFVFVVICE